MAQFIEQLIEQLVKPLSHGFYSLQAGLFEACVLPMVRFLNLTAFTNEAFDGTELFLLGMVQILVLYALIRPLERRYPAQIFDNPTDRRLDFLYTLFHRLGGFALISFFTLTPLIDSLETELRLIGFERWQLDEALHLTNAPFITFLVYFIVLDYVGYWLHRGQHRFNAWWQLHALHHANRNMSLWSDNRNHLIDDWLVAAILACVALAIGTEPAQFVGITMLTKMLQSWQHANVYLPWGRWRWLGHLGGMVFVSPTFHRTHHAISSGYEGRARGCNFGVVLPWWDFLFKTAKVSITLEPTGVRDQLTGRNYGTTVLSQQILGVLRLFKQQ